MNPIKPTIATNTNLGNSSGADIPARPTRALLVERDSTYFDLSTGPVNVDAIMRDIEKKTEQKLQNILEPVATASTGKKMEFIASQGHDLGDKLIGIMSAGAEEFKSKTGRDMTYSEMRSMYG
jgi:hypothetical protein